MSRRLRLFPLNAVLFPGAALNLHVFEQRYKQMLSDCLESGDGFGVVLIREGTEAGDPNIVPHDIGTVAKIDQVTQLPFGRYYVSTIGMQRFRISEVVSREPYLTVLVDFLPDESLPESALDELTVGVRDAFHQYLSLLSEFAGLDETPDVPVDATGMSYVVGDALQVGDAMKQRLLELPTTQQRLTVELGFLRRLIPQLESLLARKRMQMETQAGATPAPFRTDQERFFGKYFSIN